MKCCCKKSIKMESIALIRSPLRESPSRNRTIEHSPPKEVFVQAQRPPSPHIHTYYEQPVHRHVEPIVHRHVEPQVHRHVEPQHVHRHVEPQQNVRRIVGEPITTYSRVDEHQHVSHAPAHTRETR